MMGGDTIRNRGAAVGRGVGRRARRASLLALRLANFLNQPEAGFASWTQTQAHKSRLVFPETRERKPLAMHPACELLGPAHGSRRRCAGHGQRVRPQRRELIAVAGAGRCALRACSTERGQGGGSGRRAARAEQRRRTKVEPRRRPIDPVAASRGWSSDRRRRQYQPAGAVHRAVKEPVSQPLHAHSSSPPEAGRHGPCP